MKRLFLAAVVVSLLVTRSWGAAWNNSRSNSFKTVNPSATWVTATTTVSGSACSDGMYTIPASTKSFILTQLCTGSAAVRLLSDGTGGLGNIAQTGNGQTCITFTPGMILPPGSGLDCCGMTESGGWCTIAALQQ